MNNTVRKIFLSLVVLFCFTGAFSMGSKTKIPMKPLNDAVIPDGEFLHYSYYVGGEKQNDLYMVTRKETNGSGELLYQVYSITAPVTNNKKIPVRYADWPSYLLIDPRHGVIESVYSGSNINTNVNNSDAQNPYAGLIYSRYQLYKGYAEYTSIIMNNKKLTKTRTKVILKGDFPTWDGPSFFYFPTRLMDIRRGGVIYLVVPDVLKEPFPGSFKLGAKEKIQTKAGDFNANKITSISGDPFLGKLMEPVLKNAAFWVDETTGITVKIQFAFGGGVEELDEISNVNSR